MNKTVLIIFFLLLLILAFFYFFFWQRPNPVRTAENTVRIREKTYAVELAKTVLEQMQGLSGREGLDGDTGMLFLFPGGSRPGFWMKGMNFAIDIIWIADGEIIGFVENAPPAKEGGLKIYKPDREIDMVLELQAGQVREGGFQPGDKVMLD
ncbi:MAG: DUF192 domain-containing protein [Candidatus Harrisonbacteria bacterium]|nr:DUF192 domain-containing protein [Candidatus Harrisonbacteria bacterium]